MGTQAGPHHKWRLEQLLATQTGRLQRCLHPATLEPPWPVVSEAQWECALLDLLWGAPKWPGRNQLALLLFCCVLNYVYEILLFMSDS